MSNEWEKLWRELATSDIQTGSEGQEKMVERWRQVAQKLDSSKEEQTKSDTLLAFLLSRLEPDMTVLDVGAGIGRWTLPIAGVVRKVTAVEPLAGMRQVLLERAKSLGVKNLSVVETPWMEAKVPRHDVVIASHSVYTSPDLLAFVRRMEQKARRTCFLALRVPAHDGVIGELSQRIYGRWHDSANFIVGYNLLLSEGVYANVIIEPKPARVWYSPSLDDALARAKKHLAIEDSRHDAAIRALLSNRLKLVDGEYQWPDAMRSALVWWEPRRSP